MKLLGNLIAGAANVVAPGSGILIKLWGWIRPLLPWLLLAAGIAAGLLYVDHRGYSRGEADKVAKYQPVLDRALKREQFAAKSLTSASNALRVQGASIKALAAAEAVKLAEAQRAIAAAHRLDAGRNATIAKLRTSAAKPIPGPACEASAATKDAWQ
jgi:hypothetical protein